MRNIVFIINLIYKIQFSLNIIIISLQAHQNIHKLVKKEMKKFPKKSEANFYLIDTEKFYKKNYN